MERYPINYFIPPAIPTLPPPLLIIFYTNFPAPLLIETPRLFGTLGYLNGVFKLTEDRSQRILTLKLGTNKNN